MKQVKSGKSLFDALKSEQIDKESRLAADKQHVSLNMQIRPLESEDFGVGGEAELFSDEEETFK